MSQRISVFGLGYVGSVSAACFANAGHPVVGVDVLDAKVGSINEGQSPVLEPGIDEIIRDRVGGKALRATSDTLEAVRDSDFLFVCVGTPSAPNGNLDLTYVQNVSREIGRALAEIDEYRVVVYRSTLLPGTIDDRLIPILEAESGKKCGEHFSVVHNPEFLREGSALYDFLNPARTVVGQSDKRGGEAVADLYRAMAIKGSIEIISIRVAEMVKYVDNVYHATKVSFANEIGRICKANGIDSREVIRIFLMDDKLNISKAYLRPGNAFGGSCLPKDLRALLYLAKHADVDVPMLASVLESNEKHIRHSYNLVTQYGKKRIGMLGLSFKAGTDDLRESPTVELAERLLGKGYDVSIYDPHIVVDELVGANRSYIEREIPHVSQLMKSSIDEVIETAETIVVTITDPRFGDVAKRLRPDQRLIDLAGLMKDPSVPVPEEYEGIAW